DTLDGVLLSAVVESENLDASTNTEQQLQEVWQHSFAAIAQAAEAQREVFLIRGTALTRTIYPQKSERRRLYRTALPPRSAYQLFYLFPSIRQAFASGTLYASWPRQQKLKYIEKVVELIGSIDRFRYAEKLSRKTIDWRVVLAWWLTPTTASHGPPTRQR